MTQTMAFSESWTAEPTVGFIQESGLAGGDVTISYGCTGCSTWPCSCWNRYYVPWTYTYSPSITLTLDQANHLREAARKDKKLRGIVEKFRPYIAIEMAL